MPKILVSAKMNQIGELSLKKILARADEVRWEVDFMRSSGSGYRRFAAQSFPDSIVFNILYWPSSPSDPTNTVSGVALHELLNANCIDDEEYHISSSLNYGYLKFVEAAKKMSFCEKQYPFFCDYAKATEVEGLRMMTVFFEALGDVSENFRSVKRHVNADGSCQLRKYRLDQEDMDRNLLFHPKKRQTPPTPFNFINFANGGEGNITSVGSGGDYDEFRMKMFLMMLEDSLLWQLIEQYPRLKHQLLTKQTSFDSVRKSYLVAVSRSQIFLDYRPATTDIVAQSKDQLVKIVIPYHRWKMANSKQMILLFKELREAFFNEFHQPNQ